MHKKVYAFWEKLGMKYFWGDPLDSRFYIVNLLIKKPRNIIVDIGCGAGILLHFSHAKIKIGIDLSLESLITGKNNVSNDIEFIQADSRYLPLKSNFAESILSIHLISALNEKNERLKVMEEIQRIATENSELIIAGANRRSKFFKNIYSEKQNFEYTHYSEISDFFIKNFDIDIQGYGSFSNSIMYCLRFIYKIPERISESLGLENLLFFILKSKKYLKNGRSYVIVGKSKKIDKL